MTYAAPFPWPVLLVLALAGIAAILWLRRRDRGFAPRRILHSLTLLRGTLLLGLMLLLLNPSCTRRALDESAYTVVMLGDLSQSMLVPDVGSDTRLEFVLTQFEPNQPENLRQRLGNRHPVEVHGFTDRLFGANSLELQAGLPALGDALEELRTRHATRGPQLGAVVLLSDGVDRGTLSPIRAAQRYREAGIPIHVIGVGDPGEAGDLSLRFTHREHRTPRDAELTLDLEIHNEFTRQRQLRVELREEDEVIATVPVQVDPQTRERVSFPVTPRRSGFRSYSARILPGDEDNPLGNPATNVDYASVLVEEPARHSILYIGTPQWEYRFLRFLLDAEERFELKAWIQTAPNRIIQRGFTSQGPETAWEEFPQEPAALEDFAVVILDTRVIPSLGDGLGQAVRDFVSVGGGGMALWGPEPDADAPVSGMLPAREMRVLRDRQNRTLTPQPGPLLQEEDHAVYTRTPAVFLAADAIAHAPQRLARGARTALTTRDEEALFSYHAYGAGRVAHHAAEHFWRWRMESATGAEQHRRFWLSSLHWLSEARRPRLETPIQGTVQSLEEPVVLRASFLDNAFRPRPDARVHARVIGPDGSQRERLLFPRFGEPGTYEGEFELVRPGEYRAILEATLPDGETLQREVFFNASSSGAYLDTTMQEGLLRDIARLSGGTYRDWREIHRLRDPEIAREVPVVEKIIHWARSFPFALLLVGVALTEWFLRRRYGLR